MRRDGMNLFGFESERIAILKAALKASEAEGARLRAVLVLIRSDCGKVCDTFDTCPHVACASSYRAWALADQALAAMDRDRAPSVEHKPACLLGKYAYAGCTCSPAGAGYPTKTCGHPEMGDRHLVAPTTFRAACWCGRNYACPTCGFGAFTLPHDCAPPAPAGESAESEAG